MDRTTLSRWIVHFGSDAKTHKSDKSKSDKPEYEIPTVTAKQITDWIGGSRTDAESAKPDGAKSVTGILAYQI